ncbi:MAG TPA: ACT domain-containing protein [Candidatus Thermoplasmatota archaeon]
MATPEVPSLPKRVQEIFQADGILHEVVRRGLVNYRALSRWMITAHDLNASEDAVLSAIRRMKQAPGFDPFKPARALLAQCHVNVRSRACQVMIGKAEEARRKLPQMVQLVDLSKGEMLYFTWGEFGLKVLLDEVNVGSLENLFGGAAVKKIVRHLSAVTVVEPEQGLNTPGVLALMSESLALRGINVVDAVYGYPDYVFFVKESEALKAYEALGALLNSCQPKARRSATGVSIANSPQ